MAVLTVAPPRPAPLDDQVLREQAARYGGTVVGRALDRAVVGFPSVGQAVGCAVALQRASSPAGGGRLRAGLAVGDVVPAPGGYDGPPFKESAVLCRVAGEGQVVVSRLAAALEPSATYLPVAGEVLAAEGGQPGARRLDWRTPDRPAPVPQPSFGPAGPPFVGRREELATFDAAWEAVRQGGHRAFVVQGEPGVGKTRLAAELAGRVAGGGNRVLYGRCDEDLGAPYRAFVDALRQLVGVSDDTTLSRLTAAAGPGAGELTRLVPGLERRLPGLSAPSRSEPEAERYRLFDAVTRFLGAAAAEEPLLLVLDDLHWAGRPTLLMLGHLLRSPSTSGMLILATYRDTEIGRDHPLTPLLADLRGLSAVRRMRLGGLGLEEVAELAGAGLAGAGLAGASGGAPQGGSSGQLPSAALLHAETAGNPLFLTQVLRDLAEGGSLPSATRGPVPEGVRQLVARRLARLSERAASLLEVAAVVGSSFTVQVVGATAALPSMDAVLEAVDEAVAAGFIVEEPGGRGGFRFAHGLVRRAIYESLGRSRRRVLHQEVADALEAGAASEGGWAAMANHLMAAAPLEDPGRLLECGRMAALEFMEKLAFEGAAGLLERSLSLAGAPEGRETEWGEILLLLAECRFRTGDVAGSRQAAAQAARLARGAGSASLMARSAVRHLRSHGSGERDPETVALAEGALAALPQGDDALRCAVLSALSRYVFWGEGDGPRARALAGQAVEVARRTGDPVSVARALQSAAVAGMSRPDRDQASARVAELSALASASGSARHRAQALEAQAVSSLLVGDLEAFGEAAERLGELGRGLGYWPYQASASVWRATAATLAGRLDEAVGHAEEAVNYGGASVDFRTTYLAQMLAIARERGRLAEVEPLLAAALGEQAHLGVLRPLMAAVRCQLGQEVQARAELEALTADGLAGLSRDFAWPVSLALLAEVSATYRDVGSATLLYAELLPFSGLMATVAGVVCLGAVDRYLGMLADVEGRTGEADERFRAARALESQAGARPLLARTALWQARSLATRRDPTERAGTAAVLEDALRTARELGLQGLLVELEGLQGAAAG